MADSDPRRVLYLTNVPAPYRVDFFGQLSKHCELTVLYEREGATDRNPKWFEQNDGSKHHAVIMKGWSTGPDTALCPQVLKHVLSNAYDLVIVGGYSTPTGCLSILALKAAGIPYILNADGGFIKRDNIVVRCLKRLMIGGADAYLSSGSLTTLYLEYYGAQNGRIFEYPLTSVWADEIMESPLSRDLKRSSRERLGVIEETCVVAVGSFIPLKGYDVLIEAASNLGSNTGVYIVGGHPTPEYIHLRERTGAHNVHFIEFSDKDRIKEYLRAGDVFVHPTRSDVWGLVINEAMAQALPIVSTDKCLAALSLADANDPNGVLIPPGDPTALAAAIRTTLLLNSDHSMSWASLRAIRQHSIEQMAERHSQIFARICRVQD